MTGNGNPVLRVRGLTCTYPGQRTRALDGVDMDVSPGEVVLVTGMSGCGKSTLGKAVCGLISGRSLGGSVELAGLDARGLEPYDFGTLAAYVQQDPDSQLVALRVDEEVAFGLENLKTPRPQMKMRVSRALADVGASHLARRDTLSLSGGEKQRIAIASMLAMKPRLLVLDEPTSSLDPPATASVADLCSRLAREGMAVIVLEHRVAHFLPVASRVVEMDAGRVVAEETPQDYSRRAIPHAVGPAPFAALSRSLEPLLDVSNLGFAREGNRILRGIDLRIGRGEVVGLMGANGSGKTTLALCLLNLVEGWTGDVRMLGRHVRGRNTSELARTAGLVFQNPSHQLFEMTVERELAVGPEALGISLGGRENENALPPTLAAIASEYGIDGLLDRAPHSLSHGQKRRVNLASVAVSSPELLILDEPFIGQDSATAAEIASRVRAHAASGGSALVILHDAGLARACCDRVAFLEAGRIRFDYPAEEAFTEMARDPSLSPWSVSS